jgi:RNA polymerase sigma factor (sigma-70 family)
MSGAARPMRLLSDEALARRAANGSRRAFEEIYARYGQQIYRFCAAMVGDSGDAQETLQNTMVKVLRALPGERRSIALKPWLYRIARNEAIELHRRRRETTSLLGEGALVTQELTATYEARERLRSLLEDIDELPDRQRAALLMRELSDLDFGQIAAALECSEQAARQTVYEARTSLRQMEAGREMDCAHVTRALSDADGRVLRGREVRAHLRSCRSCREFRDGIASRREDLSAIVPLPAAAMAGLFGSVLGAGAGGAAGAGGLAAGTAGAGAGGVATSVLAKSAATVAVVAAVGVTGADRAGWVESPLPGGDAETVREEGGRAPAPAPAVPGSGEARDEVRPTETGGGDGRDENADRAGATSPEPSGKPSKGPADRDQAPAAAPGKGSEGGPPGKAKGHTKASPNLRQKAPKSSGGRGTRGPSEAATNGQGTAGTHKAPQANPTPGTPRGQEKGAAAPPPEPRSEPESQKPASPPAAGNAKGLSDAGGEEPVEPVAP